MADEKGTGKHPHKSTEEPYPHREGQSQQRQQASGSEQSNRGQQGSKSQSGSESRDLKEREYRDSQGNIHHHTRTAEEMKGKNKKAA